MTEIRAFFLNPEVVFKARVNQASFTYPLDEITFDGVTVGAAGHIFPNMLVLVGTTDGADDLGRQRIRKGATSTIVRVGRSSRGTRDGELDLTDNAYITVLRDWRVWARIPFIDLNDDNEIYKDSDIAANDDAEKPPPIANGGPGFAGTIDGSGIITVDFDAGESVQFDPAISSALSVPSDYLWDVDDGTIVTGTDTDDAITVEFPPGFRWVTLRVTGDNGKTSYKFIPVFARDPDNDVCVPIDIVSHPLSREGQELQIRVKQNLPRATYPDGFLIMIWDREPLSASDRKHMYFIGWHQSDDAGARSLRTGIQRDTVLTCVDAVGRLKRLPGFPLSLEAGIPSKWLYTQYPNIFYFFHHVLEWHSTVLTVADLLLGTQILNNFAFKILGSDANNLYAQVEDLAVLVTPDHHFTCTRRGQLILVVDQMIQNTADRSSSLNATLAADAYSEIRFTYERSPRVYQIITCAVLSDEDDETAIACVSPGEAQGQGVSFVQYTRRIATGQTALNVTEGNRYALANALYGPVTITCPYESLGEDFEPALMEWILLVIPTPMQPQRGAFSSDRGLAVETTINYNNQRAALTRTMILTWRQETFGPPAITCDPAIVCI